MRLVEKAALYDNRTTKLQFFRFLTNDNSKKKYIS